MDGVHQIPHGIDPLRRLLGDVHPHFLFEPGEQFDPFHRVQAEVEFQVRIGRDRGAVRGGADRRQDPRHPGVRRPDLIRVAPVGARRPLFRGSVSVAVAALDLVALQLPRRRARWRAAARQTARRRAPHP